MMFGGGLRTLFPEVWKNLALPKVQCLIILPRHSTKDPLVQGALFRNIKFKIRKCPLRIDVFSTLAIFAEGRSEAYIVSTLAGDATGSATVGVAGCPAGNPLTLFSAWPASG